jgi:hypothetical protein
MYEVFGILMPSFSVGGGRGGFDLASTHPFLTLFAFTTISALFIRHFYSFKYAECCYQTFNVASSGIH